MPRAGWSVLLLLFTTGLVAQTPADRPSHRPLGLLDESNPEESLARRLGKSRDIKGKLDKLGLDRELRKLAGDLLKDPKLLQSLKESFPPEKLQDLKKRLFNDPDLVKNLAKDPALKELLQKGAGSKVLDEKQRELLKQWQAKLPAPPDGAQPTTPTNPATPQPPLPPPMPKVDTPKQELPAWMRGRLEGWARDVEKWVKGTSGQGLHDLVRRLAENRRGGENMVSNAMGQVRGLGKYMPRASDVLPKNLNPRIGDLLPRNISPPRLPALPRAALPTAGGASRLGQAVLFLIVAAVVIVLLWRGAGWMQGIRDGYYSRRWRLGPWPVSPGAVQTREQLVRAFEYLSLLLLGPSARTRHHHDLARQIADQPAVDPDRRREAADTLAALYEQARYAPPQDDLSPEQLDRARRELRHLAGEAA